MEAESEEQNNQKGAGGSRFAPLIKEISKLYVDHLAKSMANRMLDRYSTELKQIMDASKHLSTLCSGILIASIAFRTNITNNSYYSWTVAAAVGCFLLSLILSLVAYLFVLRAGMATASIQIAYTKSIKPEDNPSDDVSKLKQNLTIFSWFLLFTFIFFVAGGILVFVFFVLNLPAQSPAQSLAIV